MMMQTRKSFLIALIVMGFTMPPMGGTRAAEATDGPVVSRDILGLGTPTQVANLPPNPPVAEYADGAPMTKLDVTVKRVTLIEGAEVRLGDVAAITGGTPDWRRRAQQLRLSAAPAPEQQMRLTESAILGALERMGLVNEWIHLYVPKGAYAGLRTERMAQSDVETLVKEAIYKQMTWSPQEIIFSDWRLPLEIVAPTGTDVEQRVELSSGSREYGLISFEIVMLSGGRPVDRVRGAVNVDVQVQVVKTRSGLRRGQMITPADVVAESVLLSKVRNGSAMRVEEVVGLVADRAIRSGDEIRTDQLRRQLWVKRNDLVSVTVNLNKNNATMRLSAQGIAQNEGAKGDVIKVLRVVSQQGQRQMTKLMMGRIVGPQQVELIY